MDVTKVAEHADYKWAVEVNRRCMSAIALWPTEDRKLYASGNIVVLLASLVIPSLLATIKVYDNFLLFADSLGYSVAVLVCLLKYVVIFNKRKVLLPIVNMMAEDWARPKTETERNVMIRRAKISRIVNSTGYFLIFVSLVLITILPRFGMTSRHVLNDTNIYKLLPIPSELPLIDITESPYFEIMFLLQIFALVVDSCTYTCVDNFFGLMILHICGQLENLRNHLVAMRAVKQFDQTLADAVQVHVRLIRAVHIVESTFSILLLAIVLYFCTLTCLHGFILVSAITGRNSFSWVAVFFLVCVLLYAMIQTSLYCIVGQILVTESEEVFNAVYSCEWTTLQRSQVKDLCMIMLRAQQPLYITIGKTLPLTMPTFTSMVKATGSYISFLLAKE